MYAMALQAVDTYINQSLDATYHSILPQNVFNFLKCCIEFILRPLIMP